MLVTSSASSLAATNWQVDEYHDSHNGKKHYIAHADTVDEYGAVSGIAIKCRKYGSQYTVLAYRDNLELARNQDPRHGYSVDALNFEFDGVPHSFAGVTDRTTKFIVGNEADDFISNLLKTNETGIPLQVYDGGQNNVDEYVNTRFAKRALLAMSTMCRMNKKYRQLSKGLYKGYTSEDDLMMRWKKPADLAGFFLFDYR